MVSQDNSVLFPNQNSFNALDFAAVQGLTGGQLATINSNGLVEKVGFFSTTPPGQNQVLWTIGQPHVVGSNGQNNNTFEMTENPANSDFEMEKSLTHSLPGNPMQEHGFRSADRPTSIPPYLGSESASQVQMYTSHTMPQGMSDPYSPAYPEQELEFEYTDNAMYEMHTPTVQRKEAVHERQRSCDQRVVSCPSLTQESRRFKIVSRERGAVFEKVEIKPRP